MKMGKTLAALTAALALLLTGCTGGGDTPTLHLYNWTYYMPDSIIEEFEEKFGCEVVTDYFSSNEEMFAKLQAGGGKGYDIVFPSADYTSIMIRLGMLEELDHSKLPNLQYIPEIVKDKAEYDPEMNYSVPYFMGAAGIAVNTELVPEDYERSWMIFADERLKGKMTLLDDMREVIGDALKTLGYSNNTGNREEIEEAAALVAGEWKPNIVKFDAESFAKAFARGEFAVVHCYPENIVSELSEEQMEHFEFFLPEVGGSMYIDNMVILKDAPEKDLAHEFINFVHTPEVYARFLDEFVFPPTTNTEAAKYMETTPLFTSEDLENYEVLVDVGEDLAIYNELWEPIRYTD